MTAAEASRNFAAVLDAAERGESIVITRAGRRLAMIGPVPAGNGAALNDILRAYRPDDGFAADVRSAREVITDEVSGAWPNA